MNSIVTSFLMTGIAGLSTMIGIFPIYMKKQKQSVIIPFCLSFAAGVMLCISFSSLIPEAVNLIREIFLVVPTILLTGIFVVLGILFSSFIDSKIEAKFSTNSLYKLGLVSVLALIFHNIPEGITTFISSKQDLTLGITLTIGIALHNIPEGISIAAPIYFATKNKKKAIFLTFISGFSELLGAFLAWLFLAPVVTSLGLGFILAIAAGIMIHISIYELLPNAYKYPGHIRLVAAFSIGFLVMYLCHFFI